MTGIRDFTICPHCDGVGTFTEFYLEEDEDGNIVGGGEEVLEECLFCEGTGIGPLEELKE
jgi:hypothetical protein